MLKRNFKRRPLSMTSLIDVIFLLLLFFMLSSTFTKYGEIDLVASKKSQSATTSDTPPLFVQLSDAGKFRINGNEVEAVEAMSEIEQRHSEGTTALILSIDDKVSSQQLVDAMTQIKKAAPISMTVVH